MNFIATNGSLPDGAGPVPSSSGQYFTPISESVTFPAGQTTESVSVPINSSATNPGLVPIQLDVTSPVRQVKGSSATVFLAGSSDAIPPSITAVQRVAGGIELTFSKPMAPATVDNIHNYAVKFSPTQKYSLEDLTGVGLIETLTASNQSIPLRRVTYDPATNSVLVVAKEQLGSLGSYKISSPASLLAKRGGPNKAHALTDLEGNPLEQSEGEPGAFSVSISKGHPYAAQPAVLSDGT